MAVGYIIAQLVGAFIAGIFIEGLFSGALQVVTQPVKIDALTATLVEALLVFFLVLVIFGTTVDRRSHTSHAGISIGLVFAVLVLLSFELTGAALNPARAFGPALVANFWDHQLVYWSGPILGALIAALVYEYGILHSNKD